MSRVQLALNVSNLDEAVSFYSKLFATEPAKLRPGYANFAIAEPPLKLVLIEGQGQPGTLNHLGVEVDRIGIAQYLGPQEHGLGKDAKRERRDRVARLDHAGGPPRGSTHMLPVSRIRVPCASISPSVRGSRM